MVAPVLSLVLVIQSLLLPFAVLLLHDWLSDRTAFTSNGGGPPAIDRRACRSSVATFLFVTHYTSSMVINAAPTMDAEDFIAPDVYEPMEHDAVECDRQRVSRDNTDLV